MEIKKTKHFKQLKELLDSCEEKGDTLFALYATEKSEKGASIFVGSGQHIMDGLSGMITESYENDSPAIEEFRHGFIAAIVEVLSHDNDIADAFAEELVKAIDYASGLRAKEREDNGGGDSDEDEFDPLSKECRECDDYDQCLLKHFKNHLDETYKRFENAIAHKDERPTNGK